MAEGRILILDDDALIRTAMADRLERAGYTVRVGGSTAEARALLRTGIPDLALLDVRLPHGNGNGNGLLPELVDELDVPVIMLAARAAVQDAVEALKVGARDYVEKPISWDRLDASVRTVLEISALRREVRAARVQGSSNGFIVGSSAAMQELMRAVARVAPTPATLWIQGETGTGKSALARLVHRLSPRAAQPFVSITCSALDETIFASELFGHEKGAFPAAHSMKRGAVELADRGTLLLDGIGALTPRLQTRLLQYIEDGTFRRVGGTRDLRADTRLIAAAHRDLQTDVDAGTFRADLYCRLRGATLCLPPLRERAGDVSDLANQFLETFRRDLGRNVRSIAPEAVALLQAHAWPGNVRELRNVIERSVLLAHGETITVHALPADVCAPCRDGQPTIRMGPDGMDIEQLERTLLREALRLADGNRTNAGRLLGLSRHQIRNRLKKYGGEA